MPIRSGFPSFIMDFVIFLPGCCFICHEMEPRSVVNFMDALNKFTSGESAPKKRENGSLPPKIIRWSENLARA